MILKKMNHRGRFFLTSFGFLAAVFWLSLTGCEPKGKTDDSPDRGLAADALKNDLIILRVGGFSYGNADFRRYTENVMGNRAGELGPESLSRLFDKFVEEKLLLEAARAQGLVLSPEEKEAYWKKMTDAPSQAEGTDAPGDYRAAGILDGLLAEKYAFGLIKDIQLDADEVNRYYQEHKRDYLLPERVKVSQILLESEQDAVRVLQKLKNAAEEDFRRVAREESAGPEAFKDGEMGVFKPGELPYEMEKVIFSLAEGTISPVVESSYGYHIFRLDRRLAPELVSEAAARPSIRMKILDMKIKELLAGHIEALKEKLEWSVHPENLTFVYQRND